MEEGGPPTPAGRARSASEKSLDGAGRAAGRKSNMAGEGWVFKPRINRCFWAPGWGRDEYSHPDRGGEQTGDPGTDVNVLPLR